MNHPRTLGPIARRLALWGLVALALLAPTPASAGPEGQLTWGVHLSLVTRWLDPGEMEGILTPFLFYYALHDALVKPMPGHAMGPSLAESWTMGKDALSYDFRSEERRVGKECRSRGWRDHERREDAGR